MTLIHARSQSGGYHYFLHAVVRLLQRFVRRGRAWNNARGNASARDRRSHIGPASDWRGERDRRWKGRGAATERFSRDPWTLAHTAPRDESPKSNFGPARVRIVVPCDVWRPGRRLTLRLSCKRSTEYAAHQLIWVATRQALNPTTPHRA